MFRIASVRRTIEARFGASVMFMPSIALLRFSVP
jgi:hypothetical protein